MPSTNRSTASSLAGRLQGLTGAYVAICLLTVVLIVALRNHASAVDAAVWTRGIVVAGAALLTLLFLTRAIRGSARAFLRFRLVTAIQLVAIVVILAVPGLLPVWMQLEQGLCGLLLLGVVVLANGPAARSRFGS